MLRRLMVVAAVLASTCTPNVTPVYAQGAPVEDVQVRRDIVERWAASSGFWAECLFPTLQADTVRIAESIPVEVVQEGASHSPRCGRAPGFVHPDTTGACALSPGELAAWHDSADTIRIVFCQGGFIHWYVQRAKQQPPPAQTERPPGVRVS